MRKHYPIKESWNINAREWINLINRHGITSRTTTNPAIMNACKKYGGQKILDLGCGQGWLTRALLQEGKTAIGVDASSALIKHANDQQPGHFYTLSYEEIIQGAKIPEAPFDSIVLNYCLYEKELTEVLLSNLRITLKPGGNILIQTIHPDVIFLNKKDPISKWIENAWEGLEGKFTHPHRWYARTMEDWKLLFTRIGYSITQTIETEKDDHSKLSLIFILAVNQ